MPRSAKKTVSDEIEDLARTLRQGAGWELREEAAEDEELTELQRRRRMGTAAAMRAALHRGDRIVVAASGLTFSQPMVSVGSDYITLRDDETTLDVRLDAAVITVTPSPRGGMASEPESATFRARLAEHEQLGRPVEILTRHGVRANGVLDVAASDHVIVSEPFGALVYLPMESVAVVISRTVSGRG